MSGQDEPCAVIGSQQLLERNTLIGRVLNWIITNSNYSWTFIVPTLHILFQEFENFHNLVKCLFSIKLLCGGLITFRIIVYEDNHIIVKVLTVYLSKVPPTTGPVPGTLNISSTWNTHTKKTAIILSTYNNVYLAMIHNNVNNTCKQIWNTGKKIKELVKCACKHCRSAPMGWNKLRKYTVWIAQWAVKMNQQNSVFSSLRNNC